MAGHFGGRALQQRAGAMIFGLTTAIFWGVADFLIKLLGPRLPLRASLFWSQGLAAAFMLGAILAAGRWPFADVAPAAVPMLATAAVANAVALGLLFFAFQNGRAAVVAPLIGSYAIVATVIGLVTGTEAVTLPLLAALATISIGALLVMFHDEEGGGLRPAAGAVAALASAVASGLTIWLTATFVLPVVAVPDVLLTNFALLTFAAWLWPGAAAVAPPRDRATWLIVIGIAIGMVAGYGLYNLGLARDGIALVSVLSTLSSAVTVLLAALIAREGVQTVQRAGIAIVLLGLPLLAAIREFAVQP
ncbi:MAG: eamA-like transporter family protein [Sphingomonas bacterium]|nr:eamA-like transporter family protein [Sphingomonas bacterium]